jgi:hypothetical protein
MNLNVKLQGQKYNYEKFQGCFCKILRFQRFSGFMELFSIRKIRRICPQHHGPGPPALAHESTDFIKKPVVGFRIDGSDWIKQIGILASNLGRSSPIWWLRRLAPAGGGTGSRSWWRVAAERSGSLDFEFSRSTVVGFWWVLLLRDHSDEGNVFMLTWIGGERQQWGSLAGAYRWWGRPPVKLRLQGCAPRLPWAPF